MSVGFILLAGSLFTLLNDSIKSRDYLMFLGLCAIAWAIKG